MDSVEAEKIAQDLVGKHVGSWEIIGLINNGKSAAVFEAKKDTQRAAIKVFDRDLIKRFGEGKQKERIEREKSLIGVEHPNLIRILDGGYCNKTDFWFVAMEYFDGPNLAAEIKNIPRTEIANIIKQVSSAAKFLEDRNIAHRDIKPENIGISPDYKSAVLMDLGVIRFIGVNGLTDNEAIRPFLGTLNYSSPEFLIRQEKDTPEGWRAVTFYQLGAVLHDLIMKEPIFLAHAEPYPRLVMAVQFETPNISATDLPKQLVHLTRNCLSKNPSHRLLTTSWESFEADFSAVDMTLNSLRKRVSDRKHSFQVAHSTSDMDANQTYLKNRKLSDIEAEFLNRIKKECIDSRHFPSLTTNSAFTGASKSSIKIIFEKSLMHQIPMPLHLEFLIDLIDDKEEIVSISLRSYLSERQGLEILDSAYPWAKAFVGVHNIDAEFEPILVAIYGYYDKAQEHCLTDANLLEKQDFLILSMEEK